MALSRRNLGGLLLAALCAPPAQAALYKYVDPDTRIASYTNFRPAQAGARELVLRPERPPSPPPRLPRLPHAGKATQRPGPGARAGVSTMLGQADFPRIDAARQRELDVDRKRILSDELQAAQDELSRLLAGRAPAEHIGRRRGDVDALQRELARLK